MAGLMDGALLPTIKCSNCGMSVEISEMGDHVCKRVPASPSPPPPSPPPKPDSATASTHLRNPSGPRLGRPGPPPRIDPSLANRPYLHPNEDLSKSEKDSLTPSPLSVSTGQRTPHLQQGSRISPLLDEPDSPDVIKPVGDLPAFPLPRSMSKKRNASLSRLQLAQTAPPVPSPQFGHAMDGEAPLPPQSARIMMRQALKRSPIDMGTRLTAGVATERPPGVPDMVKTAPSDRLPCPVDDPHSQALLKSHINLPKRHHLAAPFI
ncbi:hypothetical protein CNMCM8812_007554 [Aspergillus fumigatus]|nr:hypothetical protein CNMCM8812_007554 [Aspergillus fumigatus]